jgi:hypothetical protein
MFSLFCSGLEKAHPISKPPVGHLVSQDTPFGGSFRTQELPLPTECGSGANADRQEREVRQFSGLRGGDVPPGLAGGVGGARPCAQLSPDQVPVDLRQRLG